MHPGCAFAFTRHARSYVRGFVLEIGPEAPPALGLREFCSGWDEWDTLDMRSGAHLTYQSCEPYDYPICNAEYDTVLAANVIEHVREPWTWMRELARVLRPGGHVIIVTPATWPFHRDPVDCWRVWPDGLKALFSWAGLTPRVACCCNLDPNMPGIIDTCGVAEKC